MSLGGRRDYRRGGGGSVRAFRRQQRAGNGGALEQRLQSATAMREIMPQFADAVLSEHDSE